MKLHEILGARQDPVKGDRRSKRMTGESPSSRMCLESREVVDALRGYAALEGQRASVHQRVPARAVVDGPVVKLATERKHLTNLLKMVAAAPKPDKSGRGYVRRSGVSSCL